MYQCMLLLERCCPVGCLVIIAHLFQTPLFCLQRVQAVLRSTMFKTQFPFAIFNGSCSLVAYIVAGITGSVWALGLGMLLMLIGLFILKKL